MSRSGWNHRRVKNKKIKRFNVRFGVLYERVDLWSGGGQPSLPAPGMAINDNPEPSNGIENLTISSSEEHSAGSNDSSTLPPPDHKERSNKRKQNSTAAGVPAKKLH